MPGRFMIHLAGQQRLPKLTTPRPPPHRWRRQLTGPREVDQQTATIPCNGSGTMPTSARCPRRTGQAIHGQGASAWVEVFVPGVRSRCAWTQGTHGNLSRRGESNAFDDPVEVRRIKHQVAHEVVAEVDMRPRNVVVVGPGTIPKTPSGKLRRGCSVSLLG
jgi:hypothetical protein